MTYGSESECATHYTTAPHKTSERHIRHHRHILSLRNMSYFAVTFGGNRSNGLKITVLYPRWQPSLSWFL